MSEDEKPAVILDSGTSTLKCGLSGEDAPNVTFASCVGYPKQKALLQGSNKDYYIGEEAQQKRAVLVLKYAKEHGVTKNWDDMEKIWQHTFQNELRIVLGADDEAEDDVAGVLSLDSVRNSLEERQRTGQIMFETFQARRIALCYTNTAALYATGRTTGLMLECGGGVSSTMPVYEGYSFSHAIQRQNCAGAELTHYLCKILTESDVLLQSSAELEIAQKIIDLCYVSMNFAEEVDKFAGKEKEFELPDGSTVTVDDQIIRCPELLFRPRLDGLELPGLHEMISNTINECSVDARRDLLCNIVVAGGSTMFPNLPERLRAELEGLVPQGVQIRVVAPPERMIMPWLGGSILASLSIFGRMWINSTSQPDANPPICGYDDVGPRIFSMLI